MARLLDSVDSQPDLRKLDRAQLPEVGQEIRDQIIDVVTRIGGHPECRYDGKPCVEDVVERERQLHRAAISTGR